LVLLPALILGLGLIPAGRLTAQTLTTLHGFTATDPNTGANTDGANPQAGLVVSGNILYGTAAAGGSSGNGTVFALNTNGRGFTNLYNFTGGSDGNLPQSVLILSGSTLYGMATTGGGWGNGTVFALSTNGMGFTNLYSFTAFPVGYFTNSDGAFPHAGLILSGNTLYGTAEAGGSSGNGTVFRVNTNGLNFTNLYSFTATSGSEGFFGNGTNSDGALPVAGLILSGNTLYGTTEEGGSGGNGTVFRINTDGTGFTNLYSFTAFPASYFNSDGSYPSAGVILSGNALYGTAQYGGSSGNGTVFKLNTDGTGFTNLYSFTSGNYNSSGIITNSDGALPSAGLILLGNTLYGTADGGGISGYGTVFSLFFPPQLTIIQNRTNVIVTWPNNVAGFNYSGFTMQSTTNLVSPVVWTTNFPAPVVINGQNTVTNPISGTQQFFRLSNP
jgi:uncharacterized repeat protein (TIGR03803 family)